MRVRFHPQAWINDRAIEVDPQGETEWEVEVVVDDVEDDTYESDELRLHENAPEWVKDWTGPFFIEVLRGEGND